MTLDITPPQTTDPDGWWVLTTPPILILNIKHTVDNPEIRAGERAAVLALQSGRPLGLEKIYEENTNTH